MKIDIMTLFPEMCEAFLSESIIGRARKNGYIEIECHNIRDFTADKHNRVDDSPYGGGQGMLMQAQPIYDCFNEIIRCRKNRPRLIYMSPKGKLLTQKKALELSKLDGFAILCGHYEGVDQRLIDKIVDEEISIGDYVLTGGEMPALVLTDCVARLCDHVLSGEESFTDESHFGGLLEYPQYTRPPVWEGMEVPEVLKSGHHKNIMTWQREQALKETYLRRRDMLEKAVLSEKDCAFLKKLSESDEKTN